MEPEKGKDLREAPGLKEEALDKASGGKANIPRMLRPEQAIWKAAENGGKEANLSFFEADP